MRLAPINHAGGLVYFVIFSEYGMDFDARIDYH